MEISISNEINRFKDFLGKEGNVNILFSGAFGIGKSYFLNQYFNNEKTKEKYINIYLTPVNYSIANNEDIFEYIKVDILMQLLETIPINFEKQEVSFSNSVYFYAIYNPVDFWSKIISSAEKIAFKTDITDRIFALKKNIDAFKKNNSTDQESEVTSFFKSIGITRGTIFEDDAISQIIRSIIISAKSDGKNQKKIILTIDDLDRIDPEHIFRILNILSAHNDFCGTKEHKFGFDKTILVCDIDNIRNIYSTKYGINVDFNGYIDKFYSKEVYHFNNTIEIIKAIAHILSTTKSDQEVGLNNNNYYSHITCCSILSAFVKNRSVNVRTLLKYINKDFKGDRLVYIGRRRTPVYMFPNLVIFDFIRTMFSTIKDMESAINKLNKSNFSIEESEYILRIFIALADYHNFEKGEYIYYNKEYKAITNINIGMVDFAYGESPDIDPSLVLKEAFNTYQTVFSLH